MADGELTVSPQNCSLAYADEIENEATLFQDQLDRHMPTLKLMGRSKAELAAMEDIVEFGGTITISF
jgi:hypothetical protein